MSENDGNITMINKKKRNNRKSNEKKHDIKFLWNFFFKIECYSKMLKFNTVC